MSSMKVYEQCLVIAQTLKGGHEMPSNWAVCIPFVCIQMFIMALPKHCFNKFNIIMVFCLATFPLLESTDINNV